MPRSHEEHPEDGLDADNDGRVCEAQFPHQSAQSGQDNDGDKDCADFDTLAEAEAWHAEHPEDRLDADNDGRVCEAQLPGQDGTTSDEDEETKKTEDEDKDEVEVPTEIPAGL